MEKLEPKFERGVWLGVCRRTSDAIIGTPDGTVRARTVKRKAIEDAWKASFFNSYRRLLGQLGGRASHTRSQWRTMRRRKS